MTQATILPASADASSILSSMHQECFPRGWSEVEFLSFFERENIIALIAYDKEKPIGFIFCWVVAGHCELLSLAILDAWRGNGLGRELLEQAIARATDLGADRVLLEVGITNQSARELYASSGFEVTGRRKGYYRYPDGTTEDAITMQCAL